MSEPVDQIVEQLLRSRKYRHLCPSALRRAAEDAAVAAASTKDAVKRAKRKLHQVYAACLDRWDPDAIGALIDQIKSGSDTETVRKLCRSAMDHHAATRERLPVLDELHPAVFQVTGVPQRVLDLGCGLHPLAIPWMGLPRDGEYVGWEIDRRMVELLNHFLQRIGQGGVVHWRDVIEENPTEVADVVFMLKMLPGLERQRPGASLRLLTSLRARFAIVSFPAQSLGGRRKGMTVNYPQLMASILEAGGWPARRCDVANELIYVVELGAY